MVNYKCIRCGYCTIDKSKIKSHFNRKNICKPKLNDIDLEIYKEDILNGKTFDDPQFIPQKSSLDPHFIPKTSSLDPHFIPTKSSFIKKKEIKRDTNIVTCEFCKKEYSSKKNLWRHTKYYCKEKQKDDDCKKDLTTLVEMLNAQLHEQKEQLKKKDNQIDELIKKAGITQNIQNNIKILAYKDTDLSHLTDQDYLNCLNRSNMCIPQLIKRIHFDPRRPENHNVYISNIKNKYIMIYDGIKWNLQSQEETIDNLIDTNEFVLEQKLEEWIENGKDYPDIMRKFNRYIEKKEKDDVLNKIKEEIKLVLFNNRKTIEL